MVSTTQQEQPRKPKYWDDPVLDAMVQKDQRIAVALLVSGSLDKLDPTIGDSSCQVRALLILAMYHRLRKEFGAAEWEKAIELSKEHLQLHRVINGGPTKSAQQDKEKASGFEEAHHGGDIVNNRFEAFVTLIHTKLGEQSFELLGLAYSLWSGGIVSTDEFWIDFRYRSNNLWGRHERLLRARLAKLSCAAMIDLASELPAASKWVELLRETKSIIKRGDTESQNEEEDIEILCAQSTFSVALAVLYHYKIPIVDGNVRIQLHGADGCGHSCDHSLGNDDRPLHRTEMHNTASCNIDSCKMTYSLGAVRTLLYIPNKMTGAFEHVRSPSKEQMQLPCFFLKTWSTYYVHDSTNKNNSIASTCNIKKEDKERDDLYSHDHDRYYEALIQMDKSWAIEVMASTHPPFTRRAQHADIDIAPIFERIFGRSHKELWYDRYGIEGESFLRPEENKSHQQKNLPQQKNPLPTLADRLLLAR
ncbi:hypothetical protein BGZ68_007447 [Mortierella alpina]|nr:hypothetical protein BGZ68_007447 [Mortierella alpina]